MVAKKIEKYVEGVGRRKEAVARVRIYPSKKEGFTINDRSLEEYFGLPRLRKIAQGAVDMTKGVAVTVKVKGGGPSAQAEAIRHGSARAIVKDNEELRGELKKAGFLKRDARTVERKKFGLRKARRAPQWSKR